MKFKQFKLNIGTILLILLSSCSTSASSREGLAVRQKPVIANASEQLAIEQAQVLPISAIAEIGGEMIQLEVAKTPEQQALGLMFRESLADNRGMLFPFPSEKVARFWMKNVPIALDIIFLNGDRVVDIAANVPGCESEPCPVYGPDALVDRVIELRGGRAAELKLKINDKISVERLDSEPTKDD